MKVFFYSIDSNENKVSFQSEGIYENDELKFMDHSVPNTNITICKIENQINFIRSGDVNMRMELKEGQTNEANYQNEIGLEFKFKTFCKKLEIQKNRIHVEYDMIYENETLSQHKLWIIIR